MRVTTLLMFGPLLLVSSAFAQTDRPVLPSNERIPLWRIGTPDGSCAEFALVPERHGEFRERFAAGVRVDADQADACRSWSAIQPGPVDAWARGAPRDFRIEFTLSEPKDSVLSLWLTEVHDYFPPTVRIAGGGESVELELAPGGGELETAATEHARLCEVPIPRTMLRAGPNELTISVLRGSWLAYDALGLDTFAGELPPPKPGVGEIRPLPLVTADGDQLVRVQLRNDGRTVRARLKVAALDVDRTVDLYGFSSRWITLEIPEVTVPTPCTLSIGDARQELVLEPPRHMEVHVLLAVHTDIGYTDLPERVVPLHCRNLARMVEFCDRTDDWPAEVKPVYTIETGWQLEQFLEHGDPELVPRLVERMREGRVVVNPLFFNTLTGMATPEALVRLREFAANAERELGVRWRGASQTDTPSYSWSLCSLLANSGVRYLSTALNQHRAWFERNTDIVPPFWWEAPDGKRVLTWFNYQYGEYEYGLRGTVDDVAEDLPRYLERRYPAERYPWEMLLMHCYYGDNHELTFDPLPLMREWNERYRWPRLFASTVEGFLSRFEQRYGDEIPVHRGDWGTYWEDGIASSARATARNARNQAAADQASRLAALASAATGMPWPRAELAAAWEGILLYDEHTWGHSRSISDPDLPVVREHWAFKAACSTRPVPHIQAVTDAALDALDALPATSEFPAICVWNTLSWPRTGPVRAAVRHDGDLRLVDVTSGAEVAWQEDGDGSVVFVAEGVPAMGYRVYELQRGTPTAFPCRTTFADDRLSSVHHAVVFDPERGGVRSLRDLDTDRELVDATAPWRLGQVIHDAGEPPHHERHLADGLELVAFHAGPVVSTVTFRGRAPTCRDIRWEWSFYDRLDRIDLRVTVDKEPVTDKEALYVAFPFAAAEPTVHVETAFASFVPERDQLSGANRDWYTTIGAVSVSSPDGAIDWAPRDAPLVELGDVQTGRMLEHLELERPAILSYVMNNYWETNYRASQEPGEHVFEYSFGASSADHDAVTAHRFAQELQQPLIARGLPPQQRGAWHEPARSLLSVEPDAYALIGMQRTRDGEGTVLRFLQLAAAEQEPRLGGIFSDADARRTDCIGTPMQVPDSPTPFRVVNLLVRR